MRHEFFKDGDWKGQGGIYIRSDLKAMFDIFKNKGINPVGIIIDDDSKNIELIVEDNQAMKDHFESGEQKKATV